MFNPIETRRTADQATHVLTARAEHPHNYGTDKTVSSRDQSFHATSQLEALPVVVKMHEVIEERRATINRNHLAAHSIQQAAAQGNDTAGNLLCIDVVFLSHEPAREFFKITEGIAKGHCPNSARSHDIDSYVFVIKLITHIAAQCFNYRF